MFIYLLQGDDLVFVEESSAADSKLLFMPVAGKYLMLENPIEQFEEEADLQQKEIDAMKQLQALETQKINKLRTILILIGCAIAAVVIGRIVFIILARRKGR